MASISKEQFFAAHKKLPTCPWDLPDAGGSVTLRGLTVEEADGFNPREPLATARLVILGAFDDKGVRMFDEADLGKLSNMPSAVLEPMARKIMELSGMLAGQAAAIAKNSTATPKPVSA